MRFPNYSCTTNQHSDELLLTTRPITVRMLMTKFLLILPFQEMWLRTRVLASPADHSRVLLLPVLSKMKSSKLLGMLAWLSRPCWWMLGRCYYPVFRMVWVFPPLWADFISQFFGVVEHYVTSPDALEGGMFILFFLIAWLLIIASPFAQSRGPHAYLQLSVYSLQ